MIEYSFIITMIRYQNMIISTYIYMLNQDVANVNYNYSLGLKYIIFLFMPRLHLNCESFIYRNTTSHG
ncbi:hypothetical protein CD113_07680 [Staphylococcus simiae]|nr:hypothetical protein CD113_07680 [Staphylococcus simiae]